MNEEQLDLKKIQKALIACKLFLVMTTLSLVLWIVFWTLLYLVDNHTLLLIIVLLAIFFMMISLGLGVYSIIAMKAIDYHYTNGSTPGSVMILLGFIFPIFLLIGGFLLMQYLLKLHQKFVNNSQEKQIPKNFDN